MEGYGECEKPLCFVTIRPPRAAPCSLDQAPPPHLYAVTDDAYRAMMRGMEAKVLREASSVTVDQSMLVSGESGAGKTVSTRFIMQYLAIVGRSQQSEGASSDQDIQNRVLESNPVLESFGNARTIRNDNSSRFGKYIEIGFNTQGLLTGATIRTYLLENVSQCSDPIPHASLSIIPLSLPVCSIRFEWCFKLLENATTIYFMNFGSAHPPRNGSYCT